MSLNNTFYIVHITDDCPWCAMAKALLEYYGANYTVNTEKCPEWPTWPAIYRVTNGVQELIGGYDQLISISYESGL